MSQRSAPAPDFQLFPWTSQFETGIDQIDEQHQKLVEILNRLAWHLSAEQDELRAGDVVDELLDYAGYHFRCEEAIWKKYFSGSSLEANHHQAHEYFFEQVRHYEKRRQRGEESTLTDMFDFLTRWLAFHILEADRRMALMTFSIRAGYSIDEAADEADRTLSGTTSVMVKAILEMYSKLSGSTVQLMKERAARRAAEEELEKLRAERGHDGPDN